MHVIVAVVGTTAQFFFFPLFFWSWGLLFFLFDDILCDLKSLYHNYWFIFQVYHNLLKL
jgi:hypothetical protein